MTSRLLVLNGIAILCVILFHATGYGFTAMFSWAHRYRPVTSPNYDDVGTAAYYGLRLVEQFVTFCLPAFLFVSGYFAAVLAGRDGSVRVRTIAARVRHLLIPYLFWSLVVFVAMALQGRVFTPGRYLRSVLIGATSPNYYYVPMLAQLYVLAPFIVAAARRHARAVLATAAIAQAIVYALQYVAVIGVELPVVTAAAMALPKWVFVTQVFWFTFGVVVGLEQRAFKERLGTARWIWPAATLVLFTVAVFEWEALLQLSGSPWRENRVTMLDGLYAFTAIMTFLAYSDVRIPSAATLADLGAKSFGIYLCHGVAMDFTARGLYHLAPWILGHQALFQPIIIGLGLGVPLLLMAFMKRTRLRVYYTYVFG